MTGIGTVRTIFFNPKSKIQNLKSKID
jgi:hypothetical protein